MNRLAAGVLSVGLLVLCPSLTAAQKADLSFLLTRAEETEFRETTRYDEALAFLDVVAASADEVHLTTYGYSVEGRALPLAVFGRVRDASPRAVKQSGRIRVFVQANIHAGEVEGKEAVLMLLRDMGMGRYDHLLDSLVVLVAPLYNADGNERVSLYNRPRQHGPTGGMGTRANAQGLDLNRDHMKLASPETRSIVRLLNDFDPHVIVDLHSTNGTTHAYHLTYAPPLHPATPAPIAQFMEERWLPELTAEMLRNGFQTYHYGNLPWPGMDAPRGWYSFDYRPRFGTNYAGIRNRIAILSEAYAYLPFEERIRSSRALVDHVLRFAHENASEVKHTTRSADDAIVGKSLALRAEFEPSDEPVDILMGDVERDVHPLTGETMLRRIDAQRVEPMTAYISFRPTHLETAPVAYFLPPEAERAVEILRAHGIEVEPVQLDLRVSTEQFVLEEVTRAERAFQDRHERAATGVYEPRNGPVPAGWYRVDMAQRLGRLAFLLLEPMSSDGLLNWAVFDALIDDVDRGSTYPVIRQPAPTSVH
jgi:hypothetical protein